MKTARFARRATIAAALVGFALLGGGCNKAQKEEAAMLNQENVQLREQNSQLQSQMAAQQQQIATLQGELSSAKAAPAPMDDGLTTNYGGGGAERDVVITVAGDVLFDSGQATLKKSAKAELDKIASNIRNGHSGHRVRIEGYTDSDPIRKSKWGSNEALSQARADSVAEYLRSKGVRSVTSVGMGAANPKSTKPASRRVEIVIVGNG